MIVAQSISSRERNVCAWPCGWIVVVQHTTREVAGAIGDEGATHGGDRVRETAEHERVRTIERRIVGRTRANGKGQRLRGGLLRRTGVGGLYGEIARAGGRRSSADNARCLIQRQPIWQCTGHESPENRSRASGGHQSCTVACSCGSVGQGRRGDTQRRGIYGDAQRRCGRLGRRAGVGRLHRDVACARGGRGSGDRPLRIQT